MKCSRLVKLRQKMGFKNGFNVPPVGFAGGLSLWWDESIKVEVIFSSENLIDTVVQSVNTGVTARASWIYGTPYRQLKEEFWNWMTTHIQATDVPWFCGGDMNEIIWSHEKQGGTAFSSSRTRYLLNFISHANLIDLGFKGPKFTWRGTRNSHLIQERLDRGLVNITCKRSGQSPPLSIAWRLDLTTVLFS